MNYYFTLIRYPECPDDNSVYLLTSDTDKYVNDHEEDMQRIEIKLENDLPSLEYIALGVQEGEHEINVENNSEQTELYAQKIFEELTSKGWLYVAEGGMLGGQKEIIFDE